jgi:hypothetical protein
VELESAADERRADGRLDRLIILDVQLRADAGGLAEDDADAERAFVAAMDGALGIVGPQRPRGSA